MTLRSLIHLPIVVRCDSASCSLAPTLTIIYEEKNTWPPTQAATAVNPTASPTATAAPTMSPVPTVSLAPTPSPTVTFVPTTADQLLQSKVDAVARGTAANLLVDQDTVVHAPVEITDGRKITLIGQGFPQIAAADYSRIFHVSAGSTLVLRDLVVVGSGATAGDGGCIAVVSANLTLDSTDLRHCGSLGDGGSIAASDGAHVDLRGTSTVSQNVAAGSGGGIHLDASSLRLAGNSSVELCEATHGGGLSARDGSSIRMAGRAQVTANVAQFTGGTSVVVKIKTYL